jgi:hypothetical protein
MAGAGIEAGDVSLKEDDGAVSVTTCVDCAASAFGVAIPPKRTARL